jgi:hypothetical protein
MSLPRHRSAEDDDARAIRLARANINPVTGLATDYLNHFNEAIMLLEMLESCPDCADDFRAWKPLSYREHFAGSKLRDRALAIEAYEQVSPAARQDLDALTAKMCVVLEAAHTALSGSLTPAAAVEIAYRSVVRLKLLVARAGAVINGEADADAARTPQAAVDLLLKR